MKRTGSGSGPRQDGCTCGELVPEHLPGCPVVPFAAALSSPETTPAGVLDEAALAAVLWGEFGWASPDEDQERPRLLLPDDPYWRAAAARIVERLNDPNIDRAVSRIPALAAALGRSGSDR